MIKLIQCTETFGDCTSGYDVILDRPYTVKEFIDEVLTRDEWGSIEIADSDGTFKKTYPFYEYSPYSVVGSFTGDCFNKTIINVSALGGYRLMNYRLCVPLNIPKKEPSKNKVTVI